MLNAEPHHGTQSPWIATAKNDAAGQFHVAKAGSEDEVIAALADLVE